MAPLTIRFAERATPCVTIHRDGRFSYYDELLGCWIENDHTVPAHVLDTLPNDERNRVLRALNA